MIVGCEACAFHLHYARVNPWALKDKTKLINLAIINIKKCKNHWSVTALFKAMRLFDFKIYDRQRSSKENVYVKAWYIAL